MEKFDENNECKNSFLSKSNVNSQSAACIAEEINLCQQSFSTNCKLKKHVTTQIGKNPYTCDTC